MKTIPFTGNLTEENIKNIKEWIAALRSGDYKQTRSSLENINGFCCLGVCSKIDENVKQDIQYGFIYPNTKGIYKELPDSEWFENRFGFNYSEKLTIDLNHRSMELTELNDGIFNSSLKSFDQIADILEACFINRVEIEV